MQAGSRTSPQALYVGSIAQGLPGGVLSHKSDWCLILTAGSSAMFFGVVRYTSDPTSEWQCWTDPRRN